MSEYTSSTKSQTASTSEEATDLSLAQAAAGGDRRAQRQMLGSLLERTRTTVRYLSGDHRDQDDWVQIALLEILRSVGGFRGESSLASWADRIVVRTAMRRMRRHQRQESKVGLDTSPEPRPTREQEPHAEHDRLAMRRQLARHLGSIDPDSRTALVLKAVHGYTVDEIAGLTGAPANTVRDRLARGRRQLRKKLSLDPVFETSVPRRQP